MIQIMKSFTFKHITADLYQGLPFTLIADRCMDPHSKRIFRLIIASRASYLTCLISSVTWRAKASAISTSKRILDCISDTIGGFDQSKICGQAYAGAAVMSSDRYTLLLWLCTHTLFQTTSVQLLHQLAMISVA